MSLIDNRLSFTRPTAGGLQKRHHTNLLDRVMVDGKVRVFTDSTRGAKREEISLPDGGKVVIVKDFLVDPKHASYKSIEVYSEQEELVDSISIIEENQIRGVRFYYGNSPIGRGSGDIGMYIAQKVLGEGVLDPRYVAGSTVDSEVIKTIFNIINHKTI